ncbi:hypothetical protein LR48_Vigan06g110700 [Vigna angularis]|uniref:Uncharacterized protein n=1 Tax=Phaseolus angularis TaxID=3914 RepID=A0A0L9USV0_PHAAN|nr:hypothetical protein LR48_Vigan06g110700 [Vigna angularis]
MGCGWRDDFHSQGNQLMLKFLKLMEVGLSLAMNGFKLDITISKLTELCLGSGGDYGKVRSGNSFIEAQQWVPNDLTRILSVDSRTSGDILKVTSSFTITGNRIPCC